MPISWVEPNDPLPDPARSNSAGLVAAGRDLSAARLDEAYRKGLFPWFSQGDPVLWWSPDPRMLLRCDALHVSHSLAKRIRQFGRTTEPAALRVTTNLAFGEVMGYCARRGAPRTGIGALRAGSTPSPVPKHPEGTWITADIIEAYSEWHRQGHVHSVETWIDGHLVGGLYGVSLGGCFFGESMFSLAADASKVALAYLVAYLRHQGVAWIDCQQDTPHMARLGAQPISRPEFLELLARGLRQPDPKWARGRLLADGTLRPDPARHR